MNMVDTEKVPFLEQDEKVEAGLGIGFSKQRSRYSVFVILTLLFHCGLALFYFTVFKIYTSASTQPHTALHRESFQQGNEVLDLTKADCSHRESADFEISPFAGPPSPAVDKAWHELMSNMAIRVSAEELRRSNQTSVELPVGGGYMAWLGVYHQLHCIKMLRQWNYRDHYHPNLEPGEKIHWEIHADHCLDILRSAAMCHGDTTLTTFGWLDQPKPMLNTRPIQHKCVDWSALMDSVRHRAVSENEIAALQNPNTHMSSK